MDKEDRILAIIIIIICFLIMFPIIMSWYFSERMDYYILYNNGIYCVKQKVNWGIDQTVYISTSFDSSYSKFIQLRNLK